MTFKIYAVACSLIFFAANVSSQTLFTYGTHAVNKSEFLQAYEKNPDTSGNRTQKLHDYLDLYINFRLKLQAAYDEKANTNPELKDELQNFKNQLTENYINQQANLNQLLHEAFVRSQKDILLQQVFVPFNGIDTTGAFNQITKAYEALKKGSDFTGVAKQYSKDSGVVEAGGMIGCITVFTLPYSIENVVFALPEGAYSSIYKSAAGYHIFKNVQERNALGRRKIQQLLFSTPSFYNTDYIEIVHKKADSVYRLLRNGTSFQTQMPVYGKNYQSYDTLSAIEVGVGEYDPAFENEVFSLKKAGDISDVFKTAYGFNILNLAEIIPVSTNENDVANTAYLQQQVQEDGRLEAAKKDLVTKWLLLVHYKPSAFNKTDLWYYTDSAITYENKLPASYKNIKPETILFKFNNTDYTVSDWIDYLKTQQHIYINNPEKKQYDKFMTDFVNGSCSDFYRKNIEDFDPAMKDQLKEFNDANMLFYVMDKHVWTKASQDSAGLKSYYVQHAANYKWNKSLTALVISGTNKATVAEVAEKIKQSPLNWHNIADAYGNLIYADSSRYETDQLPVKNVEFQKDFQTTPEQNDSGDGFTFIHVFNMYNEPEARSFNDSKGLVINDYQQQLENEWIAQLKKMYPVKVNNTVLETLK